MNELCRATVCILSSADTQSDLERCLENLLEHTPPGSIQLRLGISGAVYRFYGALGLLQPDAVVPVHQALPEGWERFTWSIGGFTAKVPLKGTATKITLWHSPTATSRQRISKLVLTDVPLATEYLIWLGRCGGASGLVAGARENPWAEDRLHRPTAMARLFAWRDSADTEVLLVHGSTP